MTFVLISLKENAFYVFYTYESNVSLHVLYIRVYFDVLFLISHYISLLYEQRYDKHIMIETKTRLVIKEPPT